MLNWRVKKMVRMVLNSFSATGRRRNRKWRQEWPWIAARQKALSEGKDLECRVHGQMTMRVSPHDGAVGKTIYLTGGWEPAETKFIERYVRPGMTILDIGANVGAHTLLLAKCTGATGEVHAFEPSAAQDYLKRNLEANQLNQVTYNPVALGSAPGTLRMVRCKPGLEAFSSVGTPMSSDAADGYMDVPVETLDHYVKTKGLEQIDLAKMDVEGAEVLVLQGATELLRAQRVGAWLFEANSVCLKNVGFTPDELLGIFTDAGYQLFLLGDDGWMQPFVQDNVKKNRDVIAVLPRVIEQMQQADGPWRKTFSEALARATAANAPVLR